MRPDTTTLLLTPELVMHYCREALERWGRGEAEAWPRQESFSESAGLELFMPARLGEWEGYKQIREAPGSDGVLGARTATLLVRRPRTREAWVLPADAITDLRTGAAAVLAHQFLSASIGPGEGGNLALLGTGRVAGGIVLCLEAARRSAMLPPLTVQFTSRSPENRRAFMERFGSQVRFPLREAPSVDEAVRGADAILVAAAATQPVLRLHHLGKARQITVVAGSPTSAGVESAVLLHCDPVLLDLEPQARQSGEIKEVIRLGSWKDVRLARVGNRPANLGDAAQGRVPASEAGCSLALLTGLALLDLAVGVRLVELGAGQPVHSATDDTLRKEIGDPWQPIP